MMKHNAVERKHQLRRMSATVYHMADGAEVLKSYNTIVAMELPDGTLAFSTVWTSTDGSMTTKRHITTWSGTPINAIRNGIKSHLYSTWADVDKDYLRAIEVATGGHIG
jgi:hypothetical protein